MKPAAIRKLIRLLSAIEAAENHQIESDHQKYPEANDKKLPLLWDFSNYNYSIFDKQDVKCGSAGCAIGAAYWAGYIPEPRLHYIISFTGLDHNVAIRIFTTTDPYTVDDDYERVTPGMVSRELEKLLGATNGEVTEQC